MTSLYLLKDIDFNKDYLGVVDFDDKKLQRLYFESRRVYGFPTSYNYLRGEMQSVRVEIPQIEVQKYSYFEFTNKTPDGTMKTYYAFIDEVRYLDPSTSQIIFTIDVWQTYLFDYEIKDSFIDREHQNRFTSDLKPIFNTIPENIEVGTEYKSSIRAIDNDNAIQTGDYKATVYWLEVVSTEKLYDYGVPLTIDYYEFETPLYVYYLPFVKEEVFRLVYDFVDEEKFNLWQEVGDLYTYCVDNPNVVSIRIEKYPPFKFNYTYNSETRNFIEIEIHDDSNNLVYKYFETHPELGYMTRLFVNLRKYNRHASTIHKFKVEYDFVVDHTIKRRIENETKLYQYPYKFMQLTNYRGEYVNLKPEYLSDKEWFVKYVKSISFDYKTKAYVSDNPVSSGYLGDYRGLESNVIDNTNSELPLTTDAYKQYMATSKATATTGLAVNAGLGTAGTVAGGLMLGAGGAVGALAFLALGVGIGGLSSVKSELLQQRNLKETPDSLRQSGNNLMFDLIDGNISHYLVKKEILDEYKNILYDYFYRYGYKANRFGKPNLRSRYYFNYIKTNTIDITGNINNNVKETLKQIFNNGTTIWHCRIDNNNPDLFNYEYENIEVDL